MERKVCSRGCLREAEPWQDNSFACCVDADISIIDQKKKQRKRNVAISFAQCGWVGYRVIFPIG